MIYVLIGPSGSGKSTIENELCCHYGLKKIISYTTRKPRPGEENGKDYYFVNNETFDEMLEAGLFAEHDEYSQGRKYGTLKSDYADGSEDSVVVLTPNGLRSVKAYNGGNIHSILVTAYLGERIKRYIDRCGVKNFNYDDKNEICARVERDYGMFLGMEQEVDYVIYNNDGDDIREFIDMIFRKEELIYE